MSNIMLDLETLGTKPGSIILSIGACTFNPRSEGYVYQFYRNIDPNDSVMKGLTTDPATVKWWSEQAIEAQEALKHDRIPLTQALEEFADWFTACSGEQVWCQGLTFDIPLLEAAYNIVGLPVPWKFWNGRDTRTVYDVCGFDLRSVTREGTYHNALDDCKHQVRCIQEALKLK